MKSFILKLEDKKIETKNWVLNKNEIIAILFNKICKNKEEKFKILKNFISMKLEKK